MNYGRSTTPNTFIGIDCPIEMFGFILPESKRRMVAILPGIPYSTYWLNRKFTFTFLKFKF